MGSPFSPAILILFITVIAFLVTFVQIGILTIAFEKLGLSVNGAFTLLFVSLAGSVINLPLFRINAEAPENPVQYPSIRSFLKLPPLEFTGKTVIAVNAGGCLVPLGFSLYLLVINPMNLFEVLLAIVFVSLISYLVSRPIAGLGIGMPIFIAPITAAVTALMINPEQSAPLAYICGTLGVLTGADLLRLKDIRQMGTPVASIGGAGTFDGIFITGIVAVLLA